MSLKRMVGSDDMQSSLIVRQVNIYRLFPLARVKPCCRVTQYSELDLRHCDLVLGRVLSLTYYWVGERILLGVGEV